MHLVADESCDFSVVRALRAVPHDVIAVAESMSGATDEQVIELARSQRRLLLTEDKDFGQLVYSASKLSSGVLLIRYPVSARSSLSHSVVQLLADQGDALYGCFAVVEPGRVRLTRLL
jgi:predicted nuclease of predicted toxin-antitoxin system